MLDILRMFSIIGFWIMIIPVSLTLMAGLVNLLLSIGEYFEVDIPDFMLKTAIIGLLLWVIPGLLLLLNH